MSISPNETDTPETPNVTPRRKSGMTGETKFMIIALLVILLGGGALFGLNRLSNAPPAPEPTPMQPLSDITAAMVDDLFDKARHQKGSAGAAMTIVEFADFECPSCRRAYNDTILKMEKAMPPYRIGFMHLPLPMHERAVPAAIAAEAAAKQGKFWEMYAQLFSDKSEGLSEKQITDAATAIGLDMSRFAADRKDEKPIRDLLERELKMATENRVDSTPTFFMHDKSGNTALLSGASNLERLFPDLKDGILGNDAITPLTTPGTVPVTLFINGKKETR